MQIKLNDGWLETAQKKVNGSPNMKAAQIRAIKGIIKESTIVERGESYTVYEYVPGKGKSKKLKNNYMYSVWYYQSEPPHPVISIAYWTWAQVVEAAKKGTRIHSLAEILPKNK